MTPTLAELAEDLMAYLLPSPTFTPRERDGYVYVAGQKGAWVVRIRKVDIPAVRAEGGGRVEWWLGPSSPADAGAELLAAGLVPDEVPTLTGMTCTTEPPAAPHVEVRPAAPEEVVAMEHRVWGGEPNPLPVPSAVERHYAALLDGELVGTARSVDAHGAVALMGGVVLPQARRHGVYRALVHARWRHAVARGTPCLVVQAGAMSAPVLDGLGFRRRCELQLFVDRLG